MAIGNHLPAMEPCIIIWMLVHGHRKPSSPLWSHPLLYGGGIMAIGNPHLSFDGIAHYYTDAGSWADHSHRKPPPLSQWSYPVLKE